MLLTRPTIFSCLIALVSLSPLSHADQVQSTHKSDSTFQYQLPANINDFPNDPQKQAAMLAEWDQNINAFTQQGIAGNPWININDYPRDNYVDPRSIQKDEKMVIHPITWTAFPNRVEWYFNTSQNNPYQIPKELLFPLVDEGRLNPKNPALKQWIQYNDADQQGQPLAKKLKQLLKKHPALNSKDLSSFAPLPVPTDICPVVNWNQPADQWQTGDQQNNFGPVGPRGWKDEYNEWVVSRNEKGQITKISFTAENPEYWFTLWRVSPNKVLDLYRKLVHKNVQLEDLYLKNKKGKFVKDYRGAYAYNPLNKWNYGNNADNKGGGAAHLTSPPNTVGAEIYLGAAATIIRQLPDSEYSPQTNNCASLYGSSFRNSDPNIGMQVNQVVKNLGVPLTLTNPVSLYMQRPDFSHYTTPDGTPAAEFFTIVRGQTSDQTGRNYDEILHATFEVPAEKGYTVSDITIAGSQIWWGAQIAETFNQALSGTAYLDRKLPNNARYNPVIDNTAINPWPQPLVKMAIFEAVNEQPKISSATIPLLPPAVPAGTLLTDMALECIDGKEKATIEYIRPDGSVETGITVNIKKTTSMGSGEVTGKHGIFNSMVYVLDINIDKNVKAGQYGIRVTNEGAPIQIATPANLTITNSQ
ncbi:hypothetical protein SIN8267_01128 [Sinobacterium norvegicum]|uniref:Uncharacterized protein n=1 Tax=Sinobacterium norvegicum TaxID=1641715 RepID=A0ABM9ACV9_9GAMM|nr:hypothetical protein [Sinobacterium norvegicum]CAH0991027.1 hypothetical protein SIN8267_01128 [Sinobacterium norvegicum]